MYKRQGNIVLHKASDDSVVETFDVTSDVSGSESTEITINPSADLEKEVDYYVKIASTAIVIYLIIHMLV